MKNMPFDILIDFAISENICIVEKKPAARNNNREFNILTKHWRDFRRADAQSLGKGL